MPAIPIGQPAMREVLKDELKIVRSPTFRVASFMGTIAPGTAQTVLSVSGRGGVYYDMGGYSGVSESEGEFEIWLDDVEAYGFLNTPEEIYIYAGYRAEGLTTGARLLGVRGVMQYEPTALIFKYMGSLHLPFSTSLKYIVRNNNTTTSMTGVFALIYYYLYASPMELTYPKKTEEFDGKPWELKKALLETLGVDFTVVLKNEAIPSRRLTPQEKVNLAETLKRVKIIEKPTITLFPAVELTDNQVETVQSTLKKMRVI